MLRFGTQVLSASMYAMRTGSAYQNAKHQNVEDHKTRTCHDQKLEVRVDQTKRCLAMTIRTIATALSSTELIHPDKRGSPHFLFVVSL
eukprot:6490243-Amphidinium_carterae.2